MKDNWYLVLELEFDPPVNDEAAIKARIEQKQRFWSTHYNDFRMGNKYKVWMQSLEQIRRDMLGESNIRARLAREAEDIYYSEADSMLTALSQKGHVTELEIKRLAEKKSLPEDKLLSRARKKNITVVSAGESGSVYEKYKESFSAQSVKYRSAESLLDSLGCSDIYEFLFGRGGECLLSAAAIKQKAQEKSGSFKKNSPTDSAGKKLCGSCELFFPDEKGKADYDSYLKNRRAGAVFDEIKSIADISGALTSEQFDYYKEKLSGCFTDCGEMLEAFCSSEKIKLLSSENNKEREKAPDNKKAPEERQEEISPEELLEKADILLTGSGSLLFARRDRQDAGLETLLYCDKSVSKAGEAVLLEGISGSRDILTDIRSAVTGMKPLGEEKKAFLFIMGRLREQAREKGLLSGSEKRNVIYTLPSDCGDRGSEILSSLIEQSGFEPLACVDEVHAALLAYCAELEKKRQGSFLPGRRILMYFLSDRIFETAVYSVSKRQTDGQLVISTEARASIDRLGSYDWYKKAFGYYLDKVSVLSGARREDILSDSVRLRALSEQLYKALRSVMNGKSPSGTEIGFSAGGFSERLRLDVKDIAETTDSLTMRTLSCVDAMLRSRAIRVDRLSDIVVCSGLRDFPPIKDGIKQKYGKAPFTGSENELVRTGVRLCAGGYGEME